MSNGHYAELRRHPLLRRTDKTFDPESSFEMANLYPRTTGLAHTVWVSPRNAAHDVRIKVCLQPGDKMLADQTVSVGLRPDVHEIGGATLPRDVMEQVVRWASLNKAALVDYWDGKIDTAELMPLLKKI